MSLATTSIGIGQSRPTDTELRVFDTPDTQNKDVDKKARKLFSKSRKRRKDPSRKLRKKVNRVMNHIGTVIFLAVISFFLIFVDDIVAASGADQTTALITGIGVVQVIIFFVFLLEIIAQVYVSRKEYIISIFIILDLLALVSMVPGLLVFLFRVDGVSSLHALAITRAARAARVVTRVGRIPKFLALFEKKSAEENAAPLEPSKVGRRLVGRLTITIICMMMILLLAAILCTASPDIAPHAKVALAELHIVGQRSGIYSAEFNATLDTYVTSYADIPVLYLKVNNVEIINRDSALSITQDTYLVEFDTSLGASKVILSEKTEGRYIAGLSIALSFVVIILLSGGTFFIYKDSNNMVIRPLEKMLALIKKMSQAAAHSTTTYYDDDDDEGSYTAESGDAFTDNDFESDTDPDLETEVLVSMLNKLTHEHKEEEHRKKAQQELYDLISVIQSGAKSWVARKEYAEKRKLAKRAQLVAAEMLSTEKSYVAGLQICISQFLVPLRSFSIIEPEKIGVVFSNIEQICEYNKLLLVKLEDRILQWTPNQIVGDVFVQLTDILSIYSGYVNNFNDAIECVKSLKSGEKFAKFLEEKMATPECNNLDLQSYLIMPVQRIPRYVMLLDQLSKVTPAYHPDHLQLEEAFKLMREVTTAMNERKRDAENQITVQEIVMRMDTPIDMLLESKVALLKSGTWKHEGDSYLCYLFSNAFVQTKEKSDGLAVKAVIPMTSIKYAAISDSAQFGLYNAVQFDGPGVSLLLTCKYAEQKKEWLDTIISHSVLLKFSRSRTASHSQQRQTSMRGLEHKDSSSSLTTSPLTSSPSYKLRQHQLA